MGLTTDPTDECLGKIVPGGQQQCYLVLSEDEIAKGFVRPVRRSYIHLACGAVTKMHQRIAETYARDPKFYGGTFCVRCGDHFPLVTSSGAKMFRWEEFVEGSEYVGD